MLGMQDGHRACVWKGGGEGAVGVPRDVGAPAALYACAVVSKRGQRWNGGQAQAFRQTSQDYRRLAKEGFHVQGGGGMIACGGLTGKCRRGGGMMVRVVGSTGGGGDDVRVMGWRAAAGHDRV